MAHCAMFRGLLKEVEEDVNKFLEANPEVRVLHMVQSESEGGHISVTLLVENPESFPEGVI